LSDAQLGQVGTDRVEVAVIWSADVSS
jgi:hypothetical protein